MLRLCRWEDHKGSSSGFWLVEALPGAMLHYSRDQRGWGLIVDRDLYGIAPQGAEKAWGKNFTMQKAKRLQAQNPSLRQCFATRAALLLELESAISPAQALGAALTDSL